MEAGGVGRGESMAEAWDRGGGEGVRGGGGGGLGGGVGLGGGGGGDVLRNLSNCRACEAVLAKRQLSVQLTEVAFTGRYYF